MGCCVERLLWGVESWTMGGERVLRRVSAYSIDGGYTVGGGVVIQTSMVHFVYLSLLQRLANSSPPCEQVCQRVPIC